ncbi:MAG: response regulator [Bacteroidia bacterium]|nr:response regulator [Bacteroidia bacterium]
MEKKILLIEDEEFISMFLEDTLVRWGFTIIGKIRYGEEVMDKLEKLDPKPDLIISDINLAGKMSGVESSKLITEKYDIPLMFMSAYSDKLRKEEAEKVKNVGYITKPFDVLKLKHILDTLFDKQE